MVCYVQVKILPGALFNFIMIKQITTCFYLKFDYSDVDDCMFFPFLIFFFYIYVVYQIPEAEL